MKEKAMVELEMVDGSTRAVHAGSEVAPIQFECPACAARHARGFANGVDRFRCLRCGYSGYGHHVDPAIDADTQAELVEINVMHRALGIPEVPQGVDPLNGPG